MSIKSKHSWYHLSNYARILRHIFRYQPISRSEIADALNCPSSLVTSVTASLIEHGIIQELGKSQRPQDNTLGRKRLALGICPDSYFSVGMEISLGQFRFCLTNLAGNILQQICYKPHEKQIAHVNHSIEEGFHNLIKASGISKEKIIGGGIALPGHLNAQNGHMVTHSSLWPDFNIKTLEKSLGIKITAENNVRAMAYKKYLFDSSNCPEDFALIHVGPGIFCASFQDGILSEGGYTSGEIGHTVVNPKGQICECGKAGCLQIYTSETWLLKKAAASMRAFPESVLNKIIHNENNLSFESLLNAYELGDEFVIHEFREALHYLSIAAANSAVVLGVPKIYLNSKMFQNEMLKKEFLSFIEPQLSFIDNVCEQDIEILPFDPVTAAAGAAAMAIDRLFISSCS